MLSYIAITPARNEADNLRRLASCMIDQTNAAQGWIIVDNGSTDETPAVARRLADEHPWITLVEIPGLAVPTRGAPVVRAFHAGLSTFDDEPDVVVKLDADVSFDEHHFAKLIHAFDQDARLGIAGGTSYERQHDGSWKRDLLTGDHVRGSVRAYRWECLEQVTPLEEHMGWDGIDELKAQVRGWRTLTVPDLAYRHHRIMGSRESSSVRWSREGDLSHYMGYRFSYLLVRTAYHLRRDPKALAMLVGFVVAVLRREPRCPDEAAIAHLRRQQSLPELPSRVREKLGLTTI